MIIILFILGLAVGSFLNVLIDRMPKGKSILFPCSFCDHCKKQIFRHDLIPVLSFVYLGGRCRFCRKKISPQYPFVEFLTGILFAAAYIFLNSNHQSSIINYQFLMIYHLIIICGMIAVFFIDLKNRIIPDNILIFIGMLSLLEMFFLDRVNLPNHLFTGVGFFLFFLLLVIMTRGKGMGLGDVKFAFVIGLILGFPLVLVSFYLSFLTGALISLILVLKGKKTMKSTIPFGPFLAGSTLISLFWGDVLWRILQRIIGI